MFAGLMRITRRSLTMTFFGRASVGSGALAIRSASISVGVSEMGGGGAHLGLAHQPSPLWPCSAARAARPPVKTVANAANRLKGGPLGAPGIICP